MKNKKLMDLKKAINFFKDRGYNQEEIAKLLPIEIQVLATDMRERNNE